MIRRPPRSTLFPLHDALPISVDFPVDDPRVLPLGTGKFVLTGGGEGPQIRVEGGVEPKDVLYNLIGAGADIDRKSTRLNSSHSQISYAVFCLKKKKQTCTCYC